MPLAADPWLVSHPPSRTARLLLSLPLLLYRCRLGWVLGHRFLVICHRGRVSGQLHRTVVEVLRYDPLTQEAFVITPWPTTANWYRNLVASPAVELWIGRDRYQPQQRFLDPDEVASALDAYAQKGRGEALGLRRLMGWSQDLPPERRAEIASCLGALAFRPTP